MLLNFDQIEEKVIPKMRGGEGEMITRMCVCVCVPTPWRS